MQRYLLSIMLLCVFAAGHVYAEHKLDCPNQCVIVVDAGSTGSRLHIYSFELDKTKTPTHIKTLWGNALQPGISKLKHQDVTTYLDNLFKNVPMKKLPVYFYSTAGMRLLSQKANDDTYTLIREWFKKHDEWKLMDARTISGMEEGLWGWLAVNYQLMRLQQHNTPLVGVIDIGGASTQITIPIPNELDGPQKEQNLYSLTLYGKKINVISYSFLGLGVNELTKSFVYMPSCYFQGYPLKSGMKGSGEVTQCIEAMSKEINDKAELAKVKTLVAKYPPKEWYFIGGISSLFGNKIFHLYDEVNVQEALKVDEQVCKSGWSKVQKKYSGIPNVSNFCLYASYWYSLLVRGYTLKSKQVVHFFPNHTAPDWSLGVVLNLGPDN